VTFDQNAPFSLNGPFLSLSDDMKSTSVDMWNITVERQIERWVMSAGYVGSRTNNIWESTPLNNALFVNVNGQAPSTANLNARRPFTLADPTNGQYYGPVDLYVTDGKQHYNGMILSARRIAARTSLAVNYTLSHCYGSPDGNGGGTTNVSVGYNIPANPGFDDGNCTADRLHNFSTTASIESPQLSSPGMRAAFSGWRLAGSFSALTGSWLTIAAGTDRALNGQAATQRGNQISDNVYGDQSIDPVTGGIRFLTPVGTAFTIPALGTMGTVARNTVRGPGSKNVTLALTRNFRLTNSQAVEIRAEAFNAFNWFNWGNPSVALNSSTFGQITSTNPSISPRVIQLAAKFTF
jgi:hypothetical protein